MHSEVATQSAEEADQHKLRIPDSGRNRKPINKKQISVTTYNYKFKFLRRQKIWRREEWNGQISPPWLLISDKITVIIVTMVVALHWHTISSKTKNERKGELKTEV